MHVFPSLPKTEPTPLLHGTNDGNFNAGAEPGFQQMGSSRKKRELLLTRKKIRRGWGGRKNRKNRDNKTFSILAANANGLVGKFDSLKNNVNHFLPSCVLAQETKVKNKGCFKLQGYQNFELTRQGMGGGLLTAIDENLCPVLVFVGNEKTEFLVVC